VKILAIIFAGVCCVLLINVGYANNVSVKNIPCKAKAKISVKAKKLLRHKVTLAKPKLYFTAKSGFLWPNLREFARQFHYRLIWNVRDYNTGEYLDYHWPGVQRIVGATSLDILKKMLKPYPITVNVWKTNKVIKISNAS
jgi:hypothetical protein